MPNNGSRPAHFPGYILTGVVAFGAAFATVALFILVLGQFAMARFWEPWVAQFGTFGISILFALVALATGFTVGAVVGFALGQRSSRVTLLAGVLVAIAWLSGAVSYLGSGKPTWSSLIAAAMLAVGLVLGGFCIRHIRHAQPRVQPDPPVRALYLANDGGGGPVNLVFCPQQLTQ